VRSLQVSQFLSLTAILEHCLSSQTSCHWVHVSTARFLEQLKAECHYFNGKERVWSVTRFIYNQEEFARFNSDFGKFLAVTELGRPIVEYLNTQKDMLDNYRASVDRCRNNYDLVDIFMLNLKGKH
jgi:major histocompatibility complex class II